MAVWAGDSGLVKDVLCFLCPPPLKYNGSGQFVYPTKGNKVLQYRKYQFSQKPDRCRNDALMDGNNMRMFALCSASGVLCSCNDKH